MKALILLGLFTISLTKSHLRIEADLQNWQVDNWPIQVPTLQPEIPSYYPNDMPEPIGPTPWEKQPGYIPPEGPRPFGPI